MPLDLYCSQPWAEKLWEAVNAKSDNYFSYIFFLVVLDMEFNASHTLVKYSISELHPQLSGKDQIVVEELLNLLVMWTL